METTVFIVDANGNHIPIKISAAVLRNKKGEKIGGVETFQDLRQVEALRKKLRAKHTVVDIVGKSPAMTQLFDLLPRISDSDSTVLIEGESGTGKEVFARAIHNLSPRRKRRFVAVNCGALPDTLLESELFGYKRGAFTDAKKDKPGRFALAEGGTLFLDEIGDISPAMQVRLLRVLQEKTYEPLGSVDPTKANVRVIAASNRNLDELVQKGQFRSDLFYRLHVIRLVLPPLAKRREDIPLLAEHFIDNFNRLQGKQVVGFSPQVHAVLMEYDFPGNVRELENIVEHAFVLCHSGLIGSVHLPPHLREKAPHELAVGAGRSHLKSVERILISESLRKHQGNRGLAAKELGINTSTLYRKIKAMDIEVPAIDGRNRKTRGTKATM
jgi:transcriptional regulator with PAS, ATPase and Fis domain